MENSTKLSVDLFQVLEFDSISTPAFVYDESSILGKTTALNRISSGLGINLLFSIKSLALIDVLNLIMPMLQGFSTSSLFESKLARDAIKQNGTVHLTTPSIKDHEIESLAELCDYISFNSLTQFDRYRGIVGERARCGLRLNTGLSFVADDRYNPCRKHSKLGVSLSALINDSRREIRRISGLHFHTNCESESLEPLLATVKYLDQKLGHLLGNVDWINLGGGYQYDEIDSFEPLCEASEILQQKYGLDVFIEPGEAVVGNAGFLISSIVDLFDSEGKTIAVLDTSINHMPQVFEYQYKPDVVNTSPSGKYNYILAGATCLAGDLFGEYSFDAPLTLGSKLVFEFMGAYTLVKAHTFNGLNLPSIYALTGENKLVLKKSYSYKDYVSKWKEAEYEAR